MATSTRPFQQGRIKNGNSSDMFARPRAMAKSNITKREHLNEKVKMWTTFYRKNYHRFAEHYLDIKLFFFQKVMLYLMGISTSFMTLASRGISKSFTIGLFACCECICKPKSIVVIVASTKEQAGLIVKEKIEKELCPMSANLRREIKKIESGQNAINVIFHNGSRIIVVTSGESARGHRATCIIYEEFRLIPRQVVDEIIKPFLISRQPNYLKNPKYSHLQEEPRQIYISSAYYKSYQEGYMWSELVANTKKMLSGFEKGDFSYMVMGFDYLLAIFHGLKTRKVMDDAKAKSDEISFMMEYENIMFDENENSYFKLNMFRSNQTLKKCFYPYRSDAVSKKKKYSCNIPKQSGEIRLITADISTREGKANDNTILGCIRLLPTTKGYMREVVYLESHNGENSIRQALRIKQLYMDFEAEYVVLDLQNAGIAIYEMLGVITRDDERDVEHDAMTVLGNIRRYSDMSESVFEELNRKTLAKSAKPVIFPISASAKLNSDIAVDFRDKLLKNMISFLIEPDKAQDYLLSKDEDYKMANENLDTFEKANRLNPYNQTSELINECVNLEYTISSGNIKIDEKRGRKDRYTSISYGNYVASKFEMDLLQEPEEEFNFSNLLSGISSSNRTTLFGTSTSNPFASRFNGFK